LDQSTSSELGGLGRVANVVLSTETIRSGTYSLAASAGEGGDEAFEGRSSVTFKGIDNSFTFGLTSVPEVSRTFGPEWVTNSAGALTERREFDGVTRNTQTALSLAAAQIWGDVSLNASAKISLPRARTDRTGLFFSGLGLSTGQERLISDAPKNGTNYELAGDAETQWNPNFSSKLLAVYNRESPRATGRVERIDANGISTVRLTENNETTQETIIRQQNSLSLSNGLKLEFGVEFAQNRLDADFTNVAGGVTATTTARVREERTEPFISANWQFSPNLHLEASLVAERSTLDVVSTGAKKSRFLFWKPSLIADWKISDATSLEFKIAQDAAQLNFNDFATSVDLAADGQVDFGNRELIPERTLTFQGTLRHRFWGKGSIELIVNYQDVTDFQDLVPVRVFNDAGNIIGRFDGPGNIGSGKRWNIELSGTLPLDRFTAPLGISGMELRYLAHNHASRVNDPVTGRERLQSDTPEFHYSASLRQDFARQKWAWGVGVGWGVESVSYFFNQISRASNNPNVAGFLEFRGVENGKLRLDLSNLTDRVIERDRQFFVDSRASGLASQRFFRDQSSDSRLKITFSSTF
jgi:outer membrane receptor protein involved in Fe transport